MLAALAKYYRCSTDYLLGLTDDPTPAGEVSEISALYERLSSDRQRDLLDIAENWLADESDEFALEWLKERLKKYERQGALDVFNTMLDEEYEDMESDESGAA
ncbi:MAG: hypothetical protein KDE31_37845 [Caldilineaceae bacterium]|nr:hypothetical protein [Caldilineaceae bacterium]